jgi:hypothetical protein
MKFLVLMELEGVPGDAFIQLSELFPEARIWMNATDKQPNVTEVKRMVMGDESLSRVFTVNVSEEIHPPKDYAG